MSFMKETNVDMKVLLVNGRKNYASYQLNIWKKFLQELVRILTRKSTRSI